MEEEVEGEEEVKVLIKEEDNLEKSRARLIAVLLATAIGVSLSFGCGLLSVSLLRRSLQQGLEKWEVKNYVDQPSKPKSPTM